MRRLRNHSDEGAIALVIALLFGGGILLGAAAIAVDVGQIMSERRQVQNGADAAALSLAHDCASALSACDTSLTGTARTMANGNANDSATRVVNICGSGPGLTACGAQPGAALTQCPSVPAGVPQWIRVRTSTAQSNGSTLLPPSFARALTGNGDYTGKDVAACAQAAWGSPGGLASLPLTISQCEWDVATANGTSYVSPPPYPPYPPAAKEVKLQLHTTDEPGTCPGGSGGAYADLPGGFGWLQSATCTLTTTVGGKVPADTGASSSTCGDTVSSNVGKLMYVAVYSKAEKTGKLYTIAGYAAFYVTGYNLPAAHPKSVDSPLHGAWCKGSSQCVYGFFTQGLVPTVPAGGIVVGGPSFGASITALIG